MRSRQALAAHRLDSLSSGLHSDQEAIHRALVGEDEWGRVPLERVREQGRRRHIAQEKHFESRIDSVNEELERERRARQSGEKRIKQLLAKVAELEAHRGKHVYQRIDVESSLAREQRKRQEVADRKRELEGKFERLLHAYQHVVKGYEVLRAKYARLRATKAMSNVGRLKQSLQRVKELFANEDDPDRAPALPDVAAMQRRNQEDNLAVPEALCEYCGDSGACRGFDPTPLAPEMCVCGHEREDHDIDNVA